MSDVFFRAPSILLLGIPFPSRRIGLPLRKHSREECEFRGNIAGELRRYLPETLEKLASRRGRLVSIEVLNVTHGVNPAANA